MKYKPNPLIATTSKQVGVYLALDHMGVHCVCVCVCVCVCCVCVCVLCVVPQATGIQRHFDEQIVHYGQQVVINLVRLSLPPVRFGYLTN